MKLEIISDQKLPKEYIDVMNQNRKKNFGSKEIKNFKKDYWPGCKFFFLIENKKIIAFCGLRKVTTTYKNRKYHILGLCNLISVIKGKGFGKILMKRVIKYARTNGKTVIGFCSSKNVLFYKKSGLNIKKDFSLRFALKDPKTGKLKIDNPCYGIYINGKDNLVRKMLQSKELAYYYLPDIKDPNW